MKLLNLHHTFCFAHSARLLWNIWFHVNLLSVLNLQSVRDWKCRQHFFQRLGATFRHQYQQMIVFSDSSVEERCQVSLAGLIELIAARSPAFVYRVYLAKVIISTEKCLKKWEESCVSPLPALGASFTDPLKDKFALRSIFMISNPLQLQCGNSISPSLSSYLQRALPAESVRGSVVRHLARNRLG